MKKKTKIRRLRETKERYKNTTKTVDSDGIIRYVTDQEFLHRDDGPAVLFPEGKCEWWLYGTPFTFFLWCKRTNKTDEDIVILKLRYDINEDDV